MGLAIVAIAITAGLPILSVLALVAFCRWDDRRHRRMIGAQWDAFCEEQRREHERYMAQRARALFGAHEASSSVRSQYQ